MDATRKESLVALGLVLTLAAAPVTYAQAQYEGLDKDYLALERSQNEANAQAGPRSVPSRILPVPSTVSPRLATLISAPYGFPKWTANHPENASQWRAIVEEEAAKTIAALPKLRSELGVSIERTSIDEVPAFILTPREISTENANHVLLYVHGGGFVYNPGEAGTVEATLMAAFGGFRVISVDYRMAPDFPFPAALDDVTKVYANLVQQHGAKRIAVFGTSAGGNLTLGLILRAKAAGLPLPAAIAPGTPWSDLTETGGGDTMQTLEWVDSTLVSYRGYISRSARLYANGHDLADPLISPLRGDFSAFPPTILTSGTRDLFLSQTVLTHRKLRQAGVDARLQVFEGMSHAQYIDAQAPEALEVYREIATFFKQHLE